MTQCSNSVVPQRMPLTEQVIHKLERILEEERGYSSPCFIWQGAKINSGYGHVYVPGSPRKMDLVHRVAFEAAHGPIPFGYTIDHLCRVRLCINPDHLEAVTRAENVRRAIPIKSHCPKGHRYTSDNMMRGVRKCRECNRLDCRRRYLARKDLAA